MLFSYSMVTRWSRNRQLVPFQIQEWNIHIRVHLNTIFGFIGIRILMIIDRNQSILIRIRIQGKSFCILHII